MYLCNYNLIVTDVIGLLIVFDFTIYLKLVVIDQDGAASTPLNQNKNCQDLQRKGFSRNQVASCDDHKAK